MVARILHDLLINFPRYESFNDTTLVGDTTLVAKAWTNAAMTI